MTNIDCSDVDGYQNLTVNDFIVVPINGGAYNARGNTASWGTFSIQSYNPSTGILVFKSGNAVEYYAYYTQYVDVWLKSVRSGGTPQFVVVSGDEAYSNIYDSVNLFTPRGSVTRTVSTCVGTIKHSKVNKGSGNYTDAVLAPAGCKIQVFTGDSGQGVLTYISDGSTAIEYKYVQTGGGAVIFKN